MKHGVCNVSRWVDLLATESSGIIHHDINLEFLQQEIIDHIGDI